MICVKVGYGFFVEMTRSECIAFADKKCLTLEKQAQELTDTSSKIKTNIKLLIEVAMCFGYCDVVM